MTQKELDEKINDMSPEEVDEAINEIEDEEDKRLTYLEAHARPIIDDFRRQHPAVSISNPLLIDNNTLGFYIWGYGGFVAWKCEASKIKKNLCEVPGLLRRHPISSYSIASEKKN